MMIHSVASLGKDKTSEIVSRREVFREVVCGWVVWVQGVLTARQGGGDS